MLFIINFDIIMFMMDIRTLQIFQAVSRTGSFSRAAEALHYVQSNVSARMKLLEDELGAQLFYRQSRGVALTPAGKVLVGYADRVLNLIDEAAKAVQATLDDEGPLTIGAMETTAALRLPPILSQYHQAYPHVELTLVIGHTDALVEQVLSHQLDGAFVGGHVMHADLVRKELFAEELVLVEAKEKQPVKDRISPVLLVFRRGCSYRARAEQWMQTQGHLPIRMMEFGSLDAIVGCAAAGMGIALLPRAAVDRPQYRDVVTWKRLPSPLARVSTSFIHHKASIFTKPLAALLDLAQQSNGAPTTTP